MSKAPTASPFDLQALNRGEVYNNTFLVFQFAVGGEQKRVELPVQFACRRRSMPCLDLIMNTACSSHGRGTLVSAGHAVLAVPGGTMIDLLIGDRVSAHVAAKA